MYPGSSKEEKFERTSENSSGEPEGVTIQELVHQGGDSHRVALLSAHVAALLRL